MAAAIPDLARDRQPPASDPSYPYTVTRVEIGENADILRINRDEGGVFVELVMEPDGDRGSITRFPMDEPIKAVWHTAPEFREAAAFGAVTERAAEVVVELDDGTSHAAKLFDIPQDFKTAALAFVAQVELPRSAGEIVAYDHQREVVGRFAFPELGYEFGERAPEPPVGLLPESEFVEVATGEAVSEPWRLQAVESNQGVALKFQIQGGGHLFVPNVPDPCRVMASGSSVKGGDVRKGTVVVGAVSLDVDAVSLRLSNGQEVSAQIFLLPQEFNAEYNAYVASFPDPDPDPWVTKEPTDPRIVEIVIEDKQGRKLDAEDDGCLDY